MKESRVIRRPHGKEAQVYIPQSSKTSSASCPKKLARPAGRANKAQTLQGVRPSLLAVFLTLLDFVGQNAIVFACALVDLALVPCALAFRLELVTAGAELRDGLLRQKFLKRPLFDILLLVLFELRDELDGALED